MNEQPHTDRVSQAASTAGSDVPGPTRSLHRIAYLPTVIFLFFLVNAFCATDRVVLSVLVEPIKQELLLSDSQIGLLSFAGAVCYALFGLIAGRLTDVWSRPKVLAMSVAIYGLATAAGGLVTSFWHLFAARALVGLGDAGTVPSKYSMIGDMVRPAHRASILALIQAGVGIGTIAGMSITGVLGDQIGWRATFFWMGAPGLVLFLAILLVVREPRRGRFETAAPAQTAEPAAQRVPEPVTEADPASKPGQPPTLAQTLRVLWSNPTFLMIVGGYSFTTLSLMGIGYWMPSFLVRTYGLTLSEVGTAYGPASGAGFLLGLVVGAALSPYLLKRDRRWEMWLPGLINVLVLAANVTIYSTLPAVPVLLILTAMNSFLLGLTVGPASAAIQSTVQPRMRGVAVAITMFVSALVGQGFGPWLIGVASDALSVHFPKDGLRLSLIGASSSFILGSILYGLGGRSFNRDRVD